MRTNQRAQRCSKCGVMVEAGQGRLYKTWRMADGLEDYDSPMVWAVSCLDEGACKARVDAARSEALRRRHDQDPR